MRLENFFSGGLKVVSMTTGTVAVFYTLSAAGDFNKGVHEDAKACAALIETHQPCSQDQMGAVKADMDVKDKAIKGLGLLVMTAGLYAARGALDKKKDIAP